MNVQERLTATAHLEYPYGPVRVWDLVNTEYITPGDLIVTNKRGYDFCVSCETFFRGQ